MLEMLVLSVCIGRFECSSAWKAYYSQNKQMQDQVKILERNFYNTVGSDAKKTAFIITPLAVFASGGQAKLRIVDHLYFNGGKNSQNIAWEIKF